MTRVRRRSTGKKGWDRLVPEAQQRQNKQARIAASRVIAAVTDISPNYSGKFRTRWEAKPIGPSVEPGQEGGFVPALQGTAERRGYSIRNNSPYAAEAMDLEPSAWIRPPTPPKGPIIDEGERYGAFRGEVDGSPNPEGDTEGGAISTAERDWYVNYAQGGQFAKDVKVGAQSAVVRRTR